MKNARRSERPGLDPVVALTLIFVVLKAMGLISWSWFWVLAPLWITFFLFVSIFSAILVGGRIAKGNGNSPFVGGGVPDAPRVELMSPLQCNPCKGAAVRWRAGHARPLRHNRNSKREAAHLGSLPFTAYLFGVLLVAFLARKVTYC